jgi:hypothetical protein
MFLHQILVQVAVQWWAPQLGSHSQHGLGHVVFDRDCARGSGVEQSDDEFDVEDVGELF